VGCATGNETVTEMWENHFVALLDSTKNYETGNFVKQNINSQDSFESTGDFMCNSYKIKSLLPRLPGLCIGMSFLWESHGKHPMGWDSTHLYFP